MNEKQFEIGSQPHLIVANGGAVTINGWQRSLVAVKGETFTAVNEAENRLHIASEADLTIAAPLQSALTVETAVGNLVVKHIEGALQIGNCGGNVALNDVAQTVIKSVSGELQAENVNGRLVVQKLGKQGTLRNVQAVQIKEASAAVAINYATGFVDLSQISGAIVLNTINGDVVIRDGKGDADLRNLGGVNQVGVAGTLALSGSLAHGEHHLSAAAGLTLDWPSDAPLHLIATAAVVENSLPLAGKQETTVDGKTRLSGHIEKGKAIVVLKSNGRLRLFDSAAPVLPESAVDQLIETAVSDALVAIGGQLVPVQAARLQSPELANELIGDIKEQLTAVETKPPTQRIVEEAKTAVEDSLRQAEGIVVKGIGNAKKIVVDEDTEETATPPPAGLQSRRHILSLLRDGLVTIDQADLLLDALDKQ